MPAIVTFGKFCTGASGGDSQDLRQVLGKSARDGGRLTINPAAIPAGSKLSIGITVVSKRGVKGFDDSFALVTQGSRLTCGNPATMLGGAKMGSGAPEVPKVPAGTGTGNPESGAKTGAAG